MHPYGFDRAIVSVFTGKEIFMQNRLKSPVLWISCASLFAFVLKVWVGWEIPGFDEFTELLLGVLIAFGVVNNPTDGERF